MNFILCKWLDEDTKIKNLATKEPKNVVVLSLYDLHEIVQTKIDNLRRVLQEEQVLPAFRVIQRPIQQAHHQQEGKGPEFFPELDPSLSQANQQDKERHQVAEIAKRRKRQTQPSQTKREPEQDIINDAEGDDTLSGELGNDYIIGGEGNDTIDGGAGDDVILGEDGNDMILGGEGSDIIDGGSGVEVHIWSSLIYLYIYNILD